MTRFIILVLTLFLTTSEAYAEWVEIGTGGNVTAYVDPDTIRSKGTMVKMWSLYDYKAIYTNAGKSSWSLKSQSEYDCAEEQTRALAEYEYSGPMGNGEIVHSDSNPRNWRPVIPGSLDHTNWVFACKKLGTNGPIF